MGRAVVHFEIMGKDTAKTWPFYTEMFGWGIDGENPMQYGLVDREANLSKDGVGIGGGVGALPEANMPNYVTIYVAVPDVEASLAQAVSLGGTRLMGPEQVMPDVEIGLFSDPEGNIVGVIKEV